MKFLGKKDYLFLGPLLLGLGVYMYKLTSFPIFADEAIYLNWANRVITGQENPFISMFDGKPPLFIWLTGLLFKLIGNLFFSGRLVSVLALFALGIGIYFLAKTKKELLWLKTGFLLIIISPFVFFHGRMALMDTLLAALLLGAVLAWTQLKNYSRIIATGLLLGLAFWTKTPALFLVPFPLLSTLIFERNKKTFIAALITTVLACLVILSLKVSVWFPYLMNRSEDFSFQVTEVLAGQRDQIAGNFGHLGSWLVFYEGWVVIILAIAGIVLGIVKKNKLIINLILVSVMFAAPFLILGKVVTPRYYLFLGFTIPFLAAFCLQTIGKIPKAIALLLIILFAVSADYKTLSNPLTAHLAKADQQQYLWEWSSGIGLREASQFLAKEAQNKKILILTEGYFGTLPDGLFVLLEGNSNWHNMEVVGIGGPASENFVDTILQAKAEQIYYVGNENRIDLASREKMKLIKNYPKLNDGAPLQVYEINNRTNWQAQ
ncbi:hypothetical protein GYA49_05400 [Candidatus Beckwithbacteria bacterium]|nr:hypothetical protein [Candidatus Beckwithbacteria bacterium]